MGEVTDLFGRSTDAPEKKDADKKVDSTKTDGKGEKKKEEDTKSGKVYNCPDTGVRPECFGEKLDPRMVQKSAGFVCIDCKERTRGKSLDQWRHCPQLNKELIDCDPGAKFLFDNLEELGKKANTTRVSWSCMGFGSTCKIAPQWNPVMDKKAEWPQTDICMVCYKIKGSTKVSPHLPKVQRQTGGSSWFGWGRSRPRPVAPRPLPSRLPRRSPSRYPPRSHRQSHGGSVFD